MLYLIAQWLEFEGLANLVRYQTGNAIAKHIGPGKVSRSGRKAGIDGGPDDDIGIVEFRASYSTPHGGLGVHHERSRFIREDGRWYYLDAMS